MNEASLIRSHVGLLYGCHTTMIREYLILLVKSEDGEATAVHWRSHPFCFAVYFSCFKTPLGMELQTRNYLIIIEYFYLFECG